MKSHLFEQLDDYFPINMNFTCSRDAKCLMDYVSCSSRLRAHVTRGPWAAQIP